MMRPISVWKEYVLRVTVNIIIAEVISHKGIISKAFGTVLDCCNT